MVWRAKFINDTESDLKVEEGTGGEYTEICVVKKGRSYTVILDANATYREYHLISQGNRGSKIILSKDIMEYSEFRFFDDKENSNLDYEGTPRGKKRNAPTNPSIDQTDGNIGNTGEGGTSWFSRLFRKVTSYCHLHFDANLFSE
jgi:hypothetical protein